MTLSYSRLMESEKLMFKEKLFQEFWSKGIGKEFLDWTGATPNLEKFQSYEKLFTTYDKELDSIVEKALEDKSIGKIMRGLSKDDARKDFPQEFNNLIDSMGTPPEWLDPELISLGAELSQKSGLAGLLVLRNFSLMGGYYFSNLTKPLVATGALEKGPTHRLYYTLQFWIDVSRTGIDAQDLRMKACLRTRLMHSVSRISILKKNPDWDIADLSIPINLADMIATNIGFSFYYLYGLKQLNFKFTEEEEKGIFHLWKYVTWLLGIPAEFSPNNKKEAVEFFYYWTSKQNLPDEDSQELVAALLKENTPVSLLKFDFMKRQMPRIHKSVSNYLLDDEIKSALRIPKVGMSGFIILILKLQNRLSSFVRHEKQIVKGNKEQRSVLEDYKNNSAAHHNS